MTTTTATAPASGATRLADVDTLRGFALLGILLVNITYLASAYHGTGLEDPGFVSPLDDTVRFLVAALFELKFYLLFSFLFGYSFTLQIAAADRCGARFVPRFLRRLATLFAIGVAHAVLLFPGDILTTYAVLGLILLAVHRIRPPAAWRAATVLLLLVSTGYAFLAAAAQAAGGTSVDRERVAASAEEATAALRSGPASVIATHLQELPDVLFLLSFVQAPAALAAFLLGLAAGKRKVLVDPSRRHHTLRRLQIWGLVAGLPGGMVYGYAAMEYPGTAFEILALSINLITAPLLAAAYGATVLRLAHARGGRRMTAALAPAGRMSLTNYLTQSLVCALLFTGYGAALVGRVPPAGVAGIALALFAFQAMGCRWWLRHHTYGPVEWLLRAATNLTIRPSSTRAPESATGG